MTDEKKPVELWGENGPELLVVSDSEPEHTPGRIWITPGRVFTTADVLGDPEYRTRFEASMRDWQEKREQTMIGQYERLAEECHKFGLMLTARMQPILDEVGAQIRDMFELLADAAHVMNQFFDKQEGE